MPEEYWNMPCAMPGLTSYRYRGQFGYVMIGASNDAEAMREAQRSIERIPDIRNLNVWSETRRTYVPIYEYYA